MDHARKQHPEETEESRRKIVFPNSISQHIAEIEAESLDVYFVVLHTQSVIQETHHKRMNLA